MYQMNYEDILEDSAISSREREAILFERCIDMLNEAKAKGPFSRESSEAGNFIGEFWKVLMEDLTHPENKLPEESKAAFISIGMYVLKEIPKLKSGEIVDYENLNAIFKTIRDGLI